MAGEPWGFTEPATWDSRKPRPTEYSAIASSFGLRTASAKTGSLASSMLEPPPALSEATPEASRIARRSRAVKSGVAASSMTVQPSSTSCRQFFSSPSSAITGASSSEMVPGASVSVYLVLVADSAMPPPPARWPRGRGQTPTVGRPGASVRPRGGGLPRRPTLPAHGNDLLQPAPDQTGRGRARPPHDHLRRPQPDQGAAGVGRQPAGPRSG